AGECANEWDQDAGLRGCFWPGRQHGRRRFQSEHISHAQRVVPIHNRLLAQLAEILNQVVGERVVVIENEEHSRMYSTLSGDAILLYDNGTTLRPQRKRRAERA